MLSSRSDARKSFPAVAIFGLVLATGLASVTFGATVSSEVSPDVGAPSLRIEEGRLLLTLDEARELALERNLALVVERFRREESELSLWQSESIYDPNLTVDVGAFDETQPSVSFLDGADVQVSDGRNWNLGISRLFSSGGSGEVTWKNRRLTSNSSFSNLNPSYRVDFDLSFRQPLLRDFGKMNTNRMLRIARTNLDISRENFEAQVVAILQSIEDAYWNLVEAEAQLGVAEESLSLAQQLHDQNRIRVDVGTLAPLELVQSEAGIAIRQEQIIRSRALVGDSEDVLRQLMNLKNPEVWTLDLVPETDPRHEVVEIVIEDAIATALSERPELRSKRMTQGDLSEDIEYFQNQKMPRLDLSVVYGVNGLGGDLRETDFFTGELLREQPGDYQDAIDQAFGGDFDGWSAAVNMVYPVFNRSAKARLALAEVGFERGEAELADLKLQITTGVRRIARLVDTARQALESARVSLRLEEKNLDAEQKRYQNGMSTSFQVLEVQEDLTGARSREVAAITGYRKALVQYYRAIGRLTEQSGVEIVGPDA
jgi:outer membrane protein TolC